MPKAVAHVLLLHNYITRHVVRSLSVAGGCFANINDFHFVANFESDRCTVS